MEHGVKDEEWLPSVIIKDENTVGFVVLKLKHVKDPKSKSLKLS